MKELGEVRKRLSGEEAEQYMPFARLMLGQMKERMKLLNLQQLQWQKILAGGVLVMVSSVFGQDTITVNVPTVPVNNPTTQNELLDSDEVTYETEEVYLEIDEHYLFDGQSKFSSATGYTPINKLYKYGSQGLVLIKQMDFQYLTNAGLAINQELIMLSYTESDAGQNTNAVVVKFYNKDNLNELIEEYRFLGTFLGGTQFGIRAYQPVYYKEKFYIIGSSIGSFLYIFDKEGGFIEQRNITDLIDTLRATHKDLTVTDKDELKIGLGLNIDDDDNLFYYIEELDENFNLIGTIESPPRTSPQVSDPQDQGGFYWARDYGSLIQNQNGRFSYAKTSKATIFDPTGGTNQSQVLANSLHIYSLDDELLDSVEIQSVTNLGSTASITVKLKKYITYQVINGNKTPYSIDVYRVKEDLTEQFYYKEL